MSKIFISLFLIPFFSPVNAEVKINLKHDAKLFYLKSKKERDLKSGSIKLNSINEPLWITSKGMVPYLLIPTDKSTSEIEISSPAIKAQVRESTEEEVNLQLSSLMISVLDIQRNLSKGNIQVASNKLNKLMEERPDLHFLNFLAASVSLLKGNKSSAKMQLKKGLNYHPNYEEGLRLLEKLKEKQ